MPEGKSELSILLLAAIERLDEASRVWGWQADQGYDGAEIQKAANEHVRALYSLKLAVADALLAERQRCAKIADDEADKLKLRDGPDKRRDPLNKQIVAMKVVCRDIAASIRGEPLP